MLTFARFLEVSDGRFLAAAEQVPAAFEPNTDSRTIERGQTFVCLRGPNFDGHDFAADAIAKGCAAVVVDDVRRAPRQTAIPFIRVTDTKAAYLAAAAAARKTFRGRVIAITGSNGKTTTKEMAAQLLAAHKRIIATPQNENNELGVAKLCFRMNDRVDVAIAEFGARHPGEIAELADIAEPHIGVLTNIAEAHLEFFRNQEELARTKFALFSRGAKPVCNAADRWTRMLTAEAKLDQDALWVRLCGDPTTTGLMLEAGALEKQRVPITFGASHAFAKWKLPGEHNLRDALLAAAAAILAGLSFEAAIAGLEHLRLPPGRFELHQAPSGATIVYDAYNASPTSVEHAVRAFAQLPARRHVAVLGSMAELGPDTVQQHEATGAAVARCGIDVLYCGGAFAAALERGAHRGGMAPSAVQVYDNNDDVTQKLRLNLAAGDIVLLKGSRIEHMEEILNGLLPPGTLAS